MTTTKRVLAVATALTGVGAVTVAQPGPAAAHAAALRLGDATAEVGPGHAGIRVCHLDDDWPIARVEWRSPGSGRIKGIAATYGRCADWVDDQGINVFRLCLMTWNGDFDRPHTCTSWKDA